MANDVEWLECSEWFVQSHHIHWNVSDDLFMSQFFYAQIGRERKMWLSFLCYGANLDVILSFRVSHHVENWSFFVSLAGKVITFIHFNRTQKKCVCVEACTHEHLFFFLFFSFFCSWYLPCWSDFIVCMFQDFRKEWTIWFISYMWMNKNWLKSSCPIYDGLFKTFYGRILHSPPSE